MDFISLRENTISLKAEAETLIESVENPQYISTLNSFISSIKRLVDFLDDSKNIEVLSDYDKKPDSTKDKCPLDILCKDLYAKLVEVEAALDIAVFNYMKQDNNTISNERTQRIVSSVHTRSMGITELNTRLNALFENNLVSVFEVLKYLSGHNKTLIILGANGSGKTSFANYLKNVETHVKVIPANKPITVTGYFQSHYNSTIKTVRDELFKNKASQELLLKLIISLCSEHDDCARIYNDGGCKTKSTYDKVKEIFDEFFEVKLDNSAFSCREIKGKKVMGEPYAFNDMSDGERVAFFYIATVIVAPPQSFIVVDEPENHLNPAIYNKIWDRLMELRSDCQFIFISHTMEFINARSDFELVKIQNFTYPNNFNFEFLGNTLDDLNPDIVVEVVGSRKPILFCEGFKTDYDYKVYEGLFGDEYTVIPTGNCVSVENSVDACNAHATTYSIQSAVGIIDSDLKSDTEISRLKTKKIHTLKCNEIEMLLLDEDVFRKILVHLFKPDTVFEEFKNSFFKKMEQRKQHIIKRLVKTQIDERLRSSVIDDKTNKLQAELKANLADIFGGIDVDALWTACDAKLSEIIGKRDYNAALKYCCLEHTEVLGGVTDRFITDYPTMALGVLKNDKALAVTIKAKYFADFIE